MSEENIQDEPTQASEAEAAQFTYKWTTTTNKRLIELRRDHEDLFTGQKYTATAAWTVILEKMGLDKKVLPKQAKKKWENFKAKYKECKYPKTGEGVDGKSTAATWAYYDLMDEVLGQRHSINPPVLLASAAEDPSTAEAIPAPSGSGTAALGSGAGSGTPGPNVQAPGPKKRGRDDDLFELLKENMRLQREAEERRSRESGERMDRLFSLLERMVDK